MKEINVAPAYSVEQAEEQFKGNWADHADYNLVVGKDGDIDGDVTVWKDEGAFEPQPLLSFHRNAIPMEHVYGAHTGLSGAVKTDNRSRYVASGPVDVDEFLNSLLGTNYEYVTHDKHVLLAKHKKTGTVHRFANWRTDGIAGYMDPKGGQIPYARACPHNKQDPETFKHCFPFIETIDKLFAESLPIQHDWQKTWADKIHQDWRIGTSTYTTLTINKSYKTGYHYDGKNLESGMAAIATFCKEDVDHWSGGLLIFPRFKAAINLQPGDVAIIDNQASMHGNTPIEGERWSVVAYLRQPLSNCGSEESELKKLNAKYNKEKSWWDKKTVTLFDDSQEEKRDRRMERRLKTVGSPKREDSNSLDDLFG